MLVEILYTVRTFGIFLELMKIVLAGTTGIIPSKARWEKKQKARLRSVAFQGKNSTDARVSVL